MVTHVYMLCTWYLYNLLNLPLKLHVKKMDVVIKSRGALEREKIAGKGTCVDKQVEGACGQASRGCMCGQASRECVCVGIVDDQVMGKT